MRDVARRAAHGVGLGLLAFALLGMGSFGGGRDTGTPARDFHATLIDADGAHVEVSRVTAGGDTSLEGDLGSTTSAASSSSPPARTAITCGRRSRCARARR